jgi:hypothetical protein
MANWTALTEADLKDSAHSAIVDSAEGVDAGCSARVIADAVAKVRAAIASGNQLDVDTTKIPKSLKDLAGRIAVRRLLGIIHMELSKDEQDQRKEDNDYLKQISANKVRFELPDNPGTSEMQSSPSIQTGSATRSCERVTTRDRMRNL